MSQKMKLAEKTNFTGYSQWLMMIAGYEIIPGEVM
jgi:hypothetical protein